jgi:hypothetical protein
MPIIATAIMTVNPDEQQELLFCHSEQGEESINYCTVIKWILHTAALHSE